MMNKEFNSYPPHQQQYLYLSPHLLLQQQNSSFLPFLWKMIEYNQPSQYKGMKEKRINIKFIPFPVVIWRLLIVHLLQTKYFALVDAWSRGVWMQTM